MNQTEVKKLFKDLQNAPQTCIQNYTDEQIMEIRKYIMNGKPIDNSKKSHINISVMNLREEYMKKLLVTALVGFVYRRAEDYSPTFEVQRVEKMYDELMKEVSGPNQEAEMATLRKQKLEHVAQVEGIARDVISRYLNSMFRFNPNLHVKSAEAPTDGDAEREVFETPVVESDVKTQPDHPTVVEDIKALYSTTSLLIEELNKLMIPLEELSTQREDLVPKVEFIRKHKKQIETLQQTYKVMARPHITADTVNAHAAPPSDTFYYFTRYLHENYEELRNVCTKLYADKPDIEFSIIYYGHYQSGEDAKQYREKYADEFIFPVFEITNEKPVLLGPFQENRDRLEFYKKDTAVLQKIMDQLQSDQKLGQDLLKKRVAKGVLNDNVISEMDSNSLSKYIESTKTIRSFEGIDSALTEEERNKLYAAKDFIAQMETPENAIQVDVFDIKKDKTIKTALYTKAEKPLHLQEGSEFVDKYQEEEEYA